MADKEERIFIFTQQKACDICKKSLEEYDGLQPDCSNCPFGGDEDYPYVTRQEAIRRITRVYGCGHKAEAALNAILGVEK